MSRLLFLLSLCIYGAASGQAGSTVQDSAPLQISYSVLRDTGYTFGQIVNNNALPFIASDSLRPFSVQLYWLRIVIANPGHFSGQYILSVEPAIVNTCYYFDANSQKWLTQTSGVRAPASNEQSADLAEHLVLRPQAADTVYVKMDITELKKFNFAVPPVLNLKNRLLPTAGTKLYGGACLFHCQYYAFFSSAICTCILASGTEQYFSTWLHRWAQ